MIETGPTTDQERLRHVRVIAWIGIKWTAAASWRWQRIVNDSARPSCSALCARSCGSQRRVRMSATALPSWAHSSARHASLASVYDDAFLRQRTSPLVDDHYIAALSRDGDDAQRFGLLPANADLGLDGWIGSRSKRTLRP